MINLSWRKTAKEKPQMNLCSNEFLDFFMAIPDTAGSIGELSGYIAKSVPPVCDALGIGKIELCLNNPASPYEEHIKDNLTMLYCFTEGYVNAPLRNSYTTHSGGTAEILFYPRELIVWNDGDLEFLRFFASVLNALCGKAGLAKLANIASVTDAVTGIANTEGLNAFIAGCCANGTETSYTALYANIKNFRYFNRQLGAKYSDIILKKYAERLRDFLRRDEICGRLSDDTYLAVIKSERTGKFLEYISDIRLRLNINDMLNTFNIQSATCVYPIAKGDTASTVLYNISIAINLTKGTPGSDHIRFEPHMLDTLKREQEIAGNFSKAIALKEFDVYYQPKLDLNTGCLCGCEALVRWNRTDGLLAPPDFLHVLEKDGTVCALDLYVLEEVCIKLRAWLDLGLTPVRISTNFSKVHLHNRFLAEDIMGIINKYAIPPEYIEIELTESSGYDDFASLSDFINRIKGYGVYTSIDNFGTGYSSLKLMSDLEIDVIKLDKSFLADTRALTGGQDGTTDKDGRIILKRAQNNTVIIKAIIDMAHALGIRVICAGVENDEQKDLLTRLGCDMIQGFLYGKPLPHSEFQKRLQGIS